MTRNVLKGVMMVSAALLALVLAGKWDSETEIHIEHDYCDRVAAGVHRHYRTEIDCKFVL